MPSMGEVEREWEEERRGSSSVVGDRGVCPFSMLAAIVEWVIEYAWGQLEAMAGRGWAGRGSELGGGTTGSGGVGWVGCSLGWSSKVKWS